ncbi:hypothetical protein [Legionella sp.]|uniref:hypothetical protein n=1 Tax=Legionella sp. TaxID=459 RepID=UPI003C7FBC4C
MLIGKFHKAVTYIRETQEVALFATMADSRLYSVFSVSPLFFIMLPFIAILLTINAIINSYYLSKANNKNLEQWSGLIVSVICAVLASVSLYGATISTFLGVNFTLGPWFFFSSLMTASIHQLMMFTINARSAYESLPGSAQRMHHFQAALNNLFILGLLFSAIGSVLFVILFPTVAPLIGISCALSTVVFTGLNIIWRIVPHIWKLAIKESINLGKPELVHNNVSSSVLIHEDHKQNPNHSRLFTRFDYSVKVREMDVESAQNYLNKLIISKKSLLESKQSTPDLKTRDKIAVLIMLQNTPPGSIFSKKGLLETHPLAFQSFFAEKGDVEQIVDAFFILQEKRFDAELDNLKTAERRAEKT